MSFVIILSVLAFGTVLSYKEIPQMIKSKSHRELWSFSVLLLLGVTLAILKSLNVSMSNPSEWVAWVFSPVSEWLENFFK